jgi:hypothetical protein
MHTHQAALFLHRPPSAFIVLVSGPDKTKESPFNTKWQLLLLHKLLISLLLGEVSVVARLAGTIRGLKFCLFL